MKIGNLILCERCTAAAQAVVDANDENATMPLCYDCLSQNAVGKFRVGDTVQKADWTEADGEENRVGEITSVKHPAQTKHNCFAYGVQWPVTGGELCREDHLVIVTSAAPVTLFVEGEGWIQPLPCDSAEAAEITKNDLLADPDYFGMSTPWKSIRVTDENGKAIDTISPRSV